VTDEPIAPNTAPQAIAGPRRSYLLALFLTFIMMGLGHVYVGRARRGICLHLFVYVLVTLTIGAMAYLSLGRITAISAAILFLSYKIYTLIDIVWITRHQQHTPLRSYQKWWIYLLLFIVLLPSPYLYRFIITPIWLEAYIMPTGSMSNTIMPGDRILVEKQWLIKRPIRFGDVVAFNIDGPGSTVFVKRVIGLPGDRIEFKDEKLIRNGAPIEEPYVRLSEVPGYLPPEMINYGPITIPDEELFMAGDDRRLSYDSRSAGTYAASDVIDHVMVVYWSSVPNPPDHLYNERQLVDLGIDDDNPSGKIRWDRIGNRIINNE
jgi:signal peptidase I